MPPDNTTSTGLLLRVRDSADADSWQRLLAIYSPLLYGWLRRSDLPHQDADDLVQEVLKVVAQELPFFRHSGQRGAFRCWLRTILVHRLRSFHRSRRTHPIQVDSDVLARLAESLEDPKSSLAEAWDRDHDQYIVRKIMEIIEPEFQAVTWRAFRKVVFGAI